ncbi:hypothetical protein [Sphingobacterium deserti]|uniref:PBCV-specific basic adaptor domain-containing protein n=1 Tax=Sphingobacterium deserti TaxID=1229276 RepID=A0A0B8T4D3_9SPHI|nr:hypothetical protein [Sphingobacterium deserti]KGE14478.1 hypothetical protein DI53_1507 [Sphingobacterium deserti]
MNKLLLTFLLATISFLSYAQNQYATTSNGRTVLLKPNGTWEYVQSEGSTTHGTTSNRRSGRSTYSASSQPTSNRAKQRQYIRGPRGGCYYINSNGNKTYVDRSMCN